MRLESLSVSNFYKKMPNFVARAVALSKFRYWYIYIYTYIFKNRDKGGSFLLHDGSQT